MNQCKGLTGNPLAVSCTLNVLTVIMYEFKKEIPTEVYSMILENVLILMSSAAREILKATVSFLITLTKESFSGIAGRVPIWRIRLKRTRMTNMI